MFFIELIALYISVYGILFLSGWCIVHKICRGKYEEYKFLLTPLIGIIPLSTAPIFFSFLGINTLLSAWITFVPLALASSYILIKDYFSKQKLNYYFPFLLLFVILAAFPSLIIIWREGYLTSTMSSYSSAVIAPARFLMESPIIVPVQVDFDKPITNMLFEFFDNKEYFGFFFYLASLSSLLNIPPHKLYLVLCGIAGSFIPVCAYIISRDAFKLENKIALIISFMISINVSYLIWHLHGQLTIILGINYLILSFGFLPSIFNSKDRHDYLFFALILSGLVSNYYILGAYLLGAVIFYIIFDLKILRKSKNILKNIGIISVLTIILNPFPYAFVLLRLFDFASITSKFTKNIPRYPYIEELFGFGQHFSLSHEVSVKYYLTMAFLMILISAICVGLHDRFKKRDHLFLSIFAFIFVLGCYFLLIDFPYHFYKNSIMGVFVIISALIIGGNLIYEKTDSEFLKQSIVALLIVFVALNLKTYFRLSFFGHHSMITKSMMDLEQISEIVPGNKRILVDSHNPTEEAWISYFLKDNKIKLRGVLEPWGFWVLSPLTGKLDFNFLYRYSKDSIDFALSPRQHYNEDIIEADYGDIVYENAGYVLTKHVPKPYLLKGWFNVEKDNSGVARWTEKESFVLFDKPGNDSMLYIDGSIPAIYNKSLEIKIKINENLIDKFYSDSLEIKKRYSLRNISLKESNNVLAIILNKTFSPNEELGLRDLRRLGIRINAINIFDLGNYKIDRVIDIGKSEFDRFLLTGWSFNEGFAGKEDFSWVEGKNASLRIFVENTEDMEMQFRAQPFIYSSNPLQEMSIYLNNKFVNKITMKNTGWELYKIAIPSDVLQKGLNIVQFSFSYSETPALVLKNNTDLREISAAFDYIKFSEVPGQKE